MANYRNNIDYEIERAVRRAIREERGYTEWDDALLYFLIKLIAPFFVLMFIGLILAAVITVVSSVLIYITDRIDLILSVFVVVMFFRHALIPYLKGKNPTIRDLWEGTKSDLKAMGRLIKRAFTSWVSRQSRNNAA